jgi:hypothetical protein
MVWLNLVGKFSSVVSMVIMMTINRMRQYVWLPRIPFCDGYDGKDRGNCLVSECVWRG